MFALLRFSCKLKLPSSPQRTKENEMTKYQIFTWHDGNTTEIDTFSTVTIDHLAQAFSLGPERTGETRALHNGFLVQYEYGVIRVITN